MDRAGEIGSGAAEGLESDEVGGGIGSGRGAEEEGALGGAAMIVLGEAQVRQLPAGVGRGEGLQVDDGVNESGGFLGLAAILRRPPEVEESGVDHEPCKRERAAERGVEEGASEGADGAWREARV